MLKARRLREGFGFRVAGLWVEALWLANVWAQQGLGENSTCCFNNSCDTGSNLFQTLLLPLLSPTKFRREPLPHLRSPKKDASNEF